MRRFITLQLIKLAMMMCASGFTYDHLTDALRAERIEL